MTAKPPQYYPMYVLLTEAPCVVVGGGRIAEGKVRTVLGYGAAVTVVSPTLTPALREWAKSGQIAWVAREYRRGDLENAFLVFTATDVPEVNHAVWEEATERRILVNSVDDPPNCNFIVPSIVRQGDLTIAISTKGQSPAMAQRLRKELQARYTPEYAEFIRWLGAMRPDVKAWCPDLATREEFFREIVGSEAFDRLLAGDRIGAAAAIDRVARRYPWWRGGPTDPETGPTSCLRTEDRCAGRKTETEGGRRKAADRCAGRSEDGGWTTPARDGGRRTRGHGDAETRECGADGGRPTADD